MGEEITSRQARARWTPSFGLTRLWFLTYNCLSLTTLSNSYLSLAMLGQAWSMACETCRVDWASRSHALLSWATRWQPRQRLGWLRSASLSDLQWCAMSVVAASVDHSGHQPRCHLSPEVREEVTRSQGDELTRCMALVIPAEGLDATKEICCCSSCL